MDERSAAILEVIRKLPSKTITATMANPKSSAVRTFTGPSLFDYAVATKLFAAKMGGGTLANSYFIVTAEDGARSAVALGEAWPNASDKDVLVAYQQDGEDIRNGVRLVVTGDGLAGRSIGGVVSIDAATVTADPVPAGVLELTGQVDRPGVVDFSALPADAYAEVTTVAAVGHGGTSIDPRTYGGYRLYSILEQAGIQIDEAQHEDFVGKVVVASSTDGHSVVIAGGEIEPRFMNGDAIIATTRDGQPIEDEGGVRLMVPYDKKPGRWAKFITRLELRRA